MNTKLKVVNPLDVETIRGLQARAELAIESLITRSHLVLLQIKSIFPLDILPDRLVLDMSKVTIYSRQFLGTTTEHAIMLDEIRDVDLETSAFYSTLRILVSGPSGMWTTITNLKKSEGRLAKYVLEGLLIARKENCNLSGLGKEELVNKLCLIGGGPLGASRC
jgi:hypothetical protein